MFWYQQLFSTATFIVPHTMNHAKFKSSGFYSRSCSGCLNLAGQWLHSDVSERHAASASERLNFINMEKNQISTLKIKSSKIWDMNYDTTQRTLRAFLNMWLRWCIRQSKLYHLYHSGTHCKVWWENSKRALSTHRKGGRVGSKASQGHFEGQKISFP